VSKLLSTESILKNCPDGKCPFPVLNGHHHERSINVLKHPLVMVSIQGWKRTLADNTDYQNG
jgi:hypothetical protein